VVHRFDPELVERQSVVPVARTARNAR